MNNAIDVTDQVDYELCGDYGVSMKRCVCGTKFIAEIRSKLSSDFEECPHCGAKFYYDLIPRIYQVKE